MSLGSQIRDAAKSALTSEASQSTKFCRAGSRQPHRFVVIVADGVAVWHGDETVPPLAVILQALEQVP